MRAAMQSGRAATRVAALRTRRAVGMVSSFMIASCSLLMSSDFGPLEWSWGRPGGGGWGG